MIRLRELAALFQPPKQPVIEAKNKTSDFEGIQHVVQDALADLHDKLGTGGAVEALLDATDLSDLDKIKDKDGHTILGKLNALTVAYAKDVEKLLTEVELMLHSTIKEDLNEMASSRSFNSGFMQAKAAKELVKSFRAGGETFDMLNGDSYTAKKAIQGNKLEKDQIVFASYSSTNQGAQIYKIIGFTSDDEKYGDGGVKFNSAKELLAHYKVSSLKELEELQDKNEYGKQSYLVVKDLGDGDEGPFFYLHKGRWSRGSGAEPLSFTLVEKV